MANANLLRIVASAGIFVLSSAAGASVFDDASFWFDGAKAGTSDRTFATGDAIDIRHYATPNDAINQAAKCNGAPTVKDSTVKRNLRGDTAEQQVFYFHQGIKDGTQVYDETSGKLVSAKATAFQCLAFPETTGALERQKSFSLVIRFKLEQSMLAEWAELKGTKSNGLRSTLVCIGGESTVNGLILNLEYDNSNNTPGRYVIANRQGRFNRQLPTLGLLEAGKWYELAISSRLGSSDSANSLRFALVDESGTMTFADCVQNNTTPYWTPMGDESRRITLASSRNDAWQKDEDINSESSWFRSFNGEIATVAFWNRSLSDVEMREAFASRYPQTCPDVLRIGAMDGTAGEFAGAPASATVAAENPQAWRDLPATYSEENQTLTVNFKVSDDSAFMAGLGQLLTVKGASGAGTMQVGINGFVCDLPISTDRSIAYIPGTYITTGMQTLTLKRLTGSFSLDFISLGGSWQIGRNISTASGVGSGDMWKAAHHDYAVASGDLTKFGPTMYKTGSSLSADTLRFGLTEEMAENCPFLLTYYNHQVVGNNQVTACDVYANGKLVKESWTVRNNTRQTLRFPVGTFVAGENTLTLSNLVAAAEYVSVKSFILEIQKPRTGCVLLFR